MWEKISSKEILSHPRIRVIEDKVRLPSGKETDYVRFDILGNGATVICRNEKGEILVQKEYSYPPNQVLFQFPGGLVPYGESPEEGANRELMEESGWRAEKLTLLGRHLLNYRRSDAQVHVFLATDLKEASPEHNEEEVIESGWFTEAQIDELIGSGQIVVHTMLAAWALYKARTF